MKRRYTRKIGWPSRPQYKDQELDSEATDAAVSTSNTQEIQESSDEDTTIEPFLINAKKTKLLEEISKLKTENMALFTLLSQRRKVLTYEALLLEPQLFAHYTGMMPDNFRVFYLMLDKCDVNYFHGWKVESLDKQNQLLLFLLKVKCNFTYEDLAYRFDVSSNLVENVFLTWLHTVHKLFFIGFFCKGSIPSREENQIYLPPCFKDYPDCRIILDYTEFDVQRLYQRGVIENIYDPYVVKGLFGFAPNGTLTLASKLYPSTKSIKEMVIDSKILDRMVPGDCIIANKDFLPIKDILSPGVTLNTSPFLDSSPQSDESFVQEEIITVPKIIDGIVDKIHFFKILDIIPAQLEDFATMVWQVCLFLSFHHFEAFSDPDPSIQNS